MWVPRFDFADTRWIEIEVECDVVEGIFARLADRADGLVQEVWCNSKIVECHKAALATMDERVKKWVPSTSSGQGVKKVIFVPGKLVNLVV